MSNQSCIEISSVKSCLTQEANKRVHPTYFMALRRKAIGSQRLGRERISNVGWNEKSKIVLAVASVAAAPPRGGEIDFCSTSGCTSAVTF